MRYLLILMMLLGSAFADGKQYYLQRNDGSVSDVGVYSLQPLDREDGQWIQGTPSKDSTSFEKKKLEEAKIAQDNEVAKLAEMEARITALEEKLKGQ